MMNVPQKSQKPNRPKKQEGEKVFRNFQELNDAIGKNEVKISSPTEEISQKRILAEEAVSEITLPVLPNLEEMERNLQATEKKLEVRKKALSQKISSIKEWMPQALRRFKEMQKRLKESSSPIKEIIEEQIETLNKTITDLLAHPEKECRKTASLTYFLTAFSVELSNQTEIQDIIQDLYKKGLLKEVPEEKKWARKQATFFLGEKKLIVADSCGLTQEEKEQVICSFKEMLFRAKIRITNERKKKADEMKKKGEISLQEMLKGRNGLCFLEVPPEGEYKGGVLLVKAVDDKIYPIDASGGFEYAIQEAARLRIGKEPIFLKRLTLGIEKQPPQLNRMGETIATKLFLLWNLIQRAIRQEAKETLIRTEREEFRKKADIKSAEEFFFKKAVGSYCVEFQGPWFKNGQEIITENVFVLIDRSKTETGTVISILEIPTHLKKQRFFGDLETLEPYKEGKGFNDLPQPLKAVLQATYRQVKRSIEKKE